MRRKPSLNSSASSTVSPSSGNRWPDIEALPPPPRQPSTAAGAKRASPHISHTVALRRVFMKVQCAQLQEASSPALAAADAAAAPLLRALASCCVHVDKRVSACVQCAVGLHIGATVCQAVLIAPKAASEYLRLALLRRRGRIIVLLENNTRLRLRPACKARACARARLNARDVCVHAPSHAMRCCTHRLTKDNGARAHGHHPRGQTRPRPRPAPLRPSPRRVSCHRRRTRPTFRFVRGFRSQRSR